MGAEIDHETGRGAPDVSLAVLVGGAGSRMGHVNKALLALGGSGGPAGSGGPENSGGERVLDRLLRRAEPLFAETLLVARDPAPFAAYEGARRRIVPDLFEARSSLTGVHAALSAAHTSHVFVTACDTPLVSPAVLRLLLSRLTPEIDVLAPRWEDGHYEPLCAVYSRRCLPFAEALLRAGRYQIVRFFDRVRTEGVPMAAIRAVDPRLLTFANANTPDELAALRRLAANPKDPSCPVPGRP